MPDLITQVSRIISRIPRDHGIAVAISGGADSVALAAAAVAAVRHDRHPRQLWLLHCNFHLRGAESDRDAALAQEIAQRLSVPFLSVDFTDVKEIAARTGESIEMVCRRLRYDWFRDTIATLPMTVWLALGHHVEDNRETILLNLFRGTGVRGLAGMKEFDADRRFIRPLLHVSRSDIEQFLTACGLPWITDSSNLVPDVKRNKLRLNVIPALSRDFPDAMHGIDTTAANLTDDYAILHKALHDTISEIALDTPATYDLTKLQRISPAPRRVIFEIVRSSGFNSSQAADMAEAVNLEESKQFHSATHTALLHRGILSLIPRSDSDKIYIEADNPFTLATRSGEFTCEKIAAADPLSRLRPLIAAKIPFFAMDASAPLPSRWIWRHTATGDRIAPYGMKGRTRLVSDILTDAHASPLQKNEARLLVADGTPLWLAPWRASGFRPVTPATREFLLFRLKK